MVGNKGLVFGCNLNIPWDNHRELSLEKDNVPYLFKELEERMLEKKATTLQNSQDWSHFIIQKAPAGVITMDEQGRITLSCNNGYHS